MIASVTSSSIHNGSHRDLGVLQQFVGIVRVVRSDGDPDRRCHVDVVLLDLERL
jgi:hypothetical protein